MWRWLGVQNTIRTPGVVDQFKAEYDEQMKKEVKLNQTEVAAKKQVQEAEVRALEAKAATSSDFLRELTAEIAWTEHWEAHPEEVTQGTWTSWNKFKLDHYYPNYKVYHATHHHTRHPDTTLPPTHPTLPLQTLQILFSPSAPLCSPSHPARPPLPSPPRGVTFECG